MTRKRTIILPLATALASLPGLPATIDQAGAKVPNQNAGPTVPEAGRSRGEPTVVFNAGEELLSLTLTEENGTLVAQHYSHHSHHSHASHHSHYSSRY